MRFRLIARCLLFVGLFNCLASAEPWLSHGFAAHHAPQIVFTSTRDGNAEIYTMDADGKNSKRLTDNPADDWNPSWSPDGRRIAFQSNRDGWNVQIYVMDNDGNNAVKLTGGSIDMSPSWSPDGEK